MRAFKVIMFVLNYYIGAKKKLLVNLLIEHSIPNNKIVLKHKS